MEKRWHQIDRKQEGSDKSNSKTRRKNSNEDQECIKEVLIKIKQNYNGTDHENQI